MSKNWCQGFCRTCGTGCAQYCDQIFELREQLTAEKEARERAEALVKSIDAENSVLQVKISRYEWEQSAGSELLARYRRMEEALKKLSLGWLYWPSKRQPDPRVIMYESRSLDQIEKLAREALSQAEEKKGEG